MCVGFVVLLRSGGSFLIGGRHKYVTLFPQRRKYLGFIDFSFFLLPLVTKHPPPITTPSPLDATFHGLSPTMWFEGGWSLGFFAVERKVTFWVLSAKIKKTSEKHTFPSCHDTPRWPQFFIHTWGTLWTMAHTMPHAAGLGMGIGRGRIYFVNFFGLRDLAESFLWPALLFWSGLRASDVLFVIHIIHKAIDLSGTVIDHCLILDSDLTKFSLHCSFVYFSVSQWLTTRGRSSRTRLRSSISR